MKPTKSRTIFFANGIYDKNEMDLIVAKGLSGGSVIVRMNAPSDVTCIFMYENSSE